MESVKPPGDIIDPDWRPSFEFHTTSSHRKRKRVKVMKGTLRDENRPWGFRASHKQVISGDSTNSGSYKRKRQMHEFCSQVKVTPAMDRAKIVQENLDSKYPSFVKLMIPSNVTGGFWLSLPKPFCNSYFPSHDTIFCLVDGKGQEYKVKYLADRMGFSGGWRGFSIAHKLLEGDVLVFHFVGSCRIKFSRKSFTSLLIFGKKIDCIKKEIMRVKQAEERCVRSVPQVITQSFQNNSRLALKDQFRMETDQPKSDSAPLAFILEGLISETTSLSNAVRACKLTTSPDDFVFCDKSSKQLRASIGFRNARLNWLLYLAVTAKETTECRSYREALVEPDFGNKDRTLEVKLPNEAIERLDAEIEVLKCFSDVK